MHNDSSSMFDFSNVANSHRQNLQPATIMLLLFAVSPFSSHLACFCVFFFLFFLCFSVFAVVNDNCLANASANCSGMVLAMPCTEPFNLTFWYTRQCHPVCSNFRTRHFVRGLSAAAYLNARRYMVLPNMQACFTLQKQMRMHDMRKPGASRAAVQMASTCGTRSLRLSTKTIPDHN